MAQRLGIDIHDVIIIGVYIRTIIVIMMKVSTYIPCTDTCMLSEFTHTCHKTCIRIGMPEQCECRLTYNRNRVCAESCNSHAYVSGTHAHCLHTHTRAHIADPCTYHHTNPSSCRYEKKQRKKDGKKDFFSASCSRSFLT